VRALIAVVFVLGCPERIDVAEDSGLIDTGFDAGFDSGVVDTGVGDSGEVPDSGCEPECIRGVACGTDDGCGGACLGTCPNDFEQVCHGGICNMNSWCPQAKCDLWESVGCKPEESCYLTLDAAGQIDDIACTSPGAQLEGDGCATQTDCADGHGCLLGKCRRYCCRPPGMPFVPSSECGSARWCELFFDRIGFCESLCDMLDESTCAEDQICVVSAEYATINFCIESSDRASDVGGPCEFANDCKHGAFCRDNFCRQVCDLNGSNTCLPSESCTQAFGSAGFGVCL
jgi:hypothetical protein